METPPVIPDLSLLRRIGGGSYGDVWLARTITGVYRAVKVVDKARFADERPFLRELDGITRFQRSVGDQPRQLALMHVGRLEEQGIFYYVMELADDVEAGTDIDPEKYQPLTLKALHEKRPVLPAAEVIRIGSELARSLVGLHTAGLIHRDVKPSNIIFVAGVPKLADIGLVSSSDHTLTSLGTPGYSPPEGAGTVRADVYSLGKILYQLATGLHTDEFPRLPTDVGTREDVRQLLELNEVVLKACQPRPEDRYASAQAMLDELMLLHAGRSVKELNAARERLKRLGRAAIWLGAAAAVVIAVLGVRNYFAVKALAAQERHARIQAEEDERLARYTSDLTLARLSLDNSDLSVARAALRRQVPTPGEKDLRGIEWHALWKETEGDDVRRLGDVGDPAIRDLRLSPDRSSVLALEVGMSQRAVLWSLAGNERRELASDVRDLGGFTSDGAAVVLGMVDRSIQLVDLTSGQATVVAGLTGRIQSPMQDGRTILVGQLLEGVVHLSLWSLIEMRELASWSASGEGVGTELSAVALDASATRLALAMTKRQGARESLELVVVDLRSSVELFRRTDLGRWQTLAFSEDGQLIAAGGLGQPLTVLDSTTGVTLRTFPAQRGAVFSAVISPDRSRIAVAGDDHTLRLWSLQGDEQSLALRGHESGITDLSWVGDDGLISSGNDGTLRLWSTGVDRRENAVAGIWNDLLGGVAFDEPRGQILATGSEGTLLRFDEATLQRLDPPVAAFHPLLVRGDSLLALDSKLALATVNLADGTMQDGGLAVGEGDRVRIARASPDARWVALGLFDGRIRLWDLETRTEALLPASHRHAIWTLDFSGDSRLLVAGDQLGVVSLHEVSGGVPARLMDAYRIPVTALTFFDEGRRLFVGREDGSVQVLDTENLQVVGEFRGHSRAVWSVQVSPDQQRVVTAGSDGLALVWKLDDFRLLVALPTREVPERRNMGGQAPLYSLHFSEDGGQLLARTDEGSLFRWDLR